MNFCLITTVILCCVALFFGCSDKGQESRETFAQSFNKTQERALLIDVDQRIDQLAKLVDAKNISIPPITQDAIMIANRAINVLIKYFGEDDEMNLFKDDFAKLIASARGFDANLIPKIDTAVEYLEKSIDENLEIFPYWPVYEFELSLSQILMDKFLDTDTFARTEIALKCASGLLDFCPQKNHEIAALVDRFLSIMKSKNVVLPSWMMNKRLFDYLYFLLENGALPGDIRSFAIHLIVKGLDILEQAPIVGDSPNYHAFLKYVWDRFDFSRDEERIMMNIQNNIGRICETITHRLGFRYGLVEKPTVAVV